MNSYSSYMWHPHFWSHFGQKRCILCAGNYVRVGFQRIWVYLLRVLWLHGVHWRMKGAIGSDWRFNFCRHVIGNMLNSEELWCISSTVSSCSTTKSKWTHLFPISFYSRWWSRNMRELLSEQVLFAARKKEFGRFLGATKFHPLKQ